SCIDVAHDALGKLIDRSGDPRYADVVFERTRTPVHVVAVENVFERNGLTEVDMHLPEPLPELAQRAQEAEHAFFFLRLARELAYVGRAFDDALVAEVHGQEDHRPSRVAQKTAHGHGEHAGLRLQQAAGAAAAAFDEILDGVPPRHDGSDVFHEDDGVEAVAAELAANEEGAAHAQQPADDGEVEVDACRNVRHEIAVDVDDVRQQQIIHMTAMTGHIDDLVALRGAFEGLQVSDGDAVIEAIPEPGQQTFQEPDEGMRVVRGNLFRVTRRLKQCHPAGERLLAHFLGHGGAHGVRPQYACDDGAPVREVGSNARGSMLRIERTERAGDAAAAYRQPDLIAEQAAQRNGLFQLNERITSVEDDLQELAGAAGQRPVL